MEVKRAEYPEKTCREPLFGESGLGYTCELPNLHTGPHATFSDTGSVARRDRWEEQNPGKIGQTDLDGDIIVDKSGKRIQ